MIIIHLWKKIPDKEVESHVYITWKTWSWKSSIIEQWVYSQWWKSRKKEDRSIIVIDPHGDMVDKIRHFDLADKFFDRHIYIDPTLSEWNIPCFNPMECRERNSLDIEIKANQLVRAIQEMIPDAKLTNFMKAVLKPVVYILLSINTSTIADIQTFLWQEEWHFVEHGKRSEIKAYSDFFKNEWNNPMYARTKQSIYTKIQSLLNSQIFYHMTIGRSTINLDRSIKEWKIILFNLSKWKIWEEVCESLWRFIIAQVKSIALKRANLPHHLRKPIYLIIDEADTFIKGDSLNVILKETRKYWLHILVITQSLISWKSQQSLRRNILNNTNVKIIGANWISTLKPLSGETSILLKELQALEFHQFRIKYSAFIKRKIKTRDVLRAKSPLLLKWPKMISQTNKMVHHSWYYRPYIQYLDNKEWIEEFPLDMHKRLEHKHYPKPKFSL